MGTKKKTRRYAEDTTVSVKRSREEIEKYLIGQGAEGFSYRWFETPKGRGGAIEFRMYSQDVRMIVPPAETPQQEKQRWRVLLLILKAKIETIQTGVGQFEEEFLSYLILPNGDTVGSHVLPRLPQLMSPRPEE